ncbi:hypothetical protein IAR55_001617 [Kwoniella newhampshirensis]|uniref:Uncharacterized protein n=1 Tax=Kwoniella newhampshirensis TaxID=1651941 RepID=A0AAW0Z2H9_9TREE
MTHTKTTSTGEAPITPKVMADANALNRQLSDDSQLPKLDRLVNNSVPGSWVSNDMLLPETKTDQKEPASAFIDRISVFLFFVSPKRRVHDTLSHDNSQDQSLDEMIGL